MACGGGDGDGGCRFFESPTKWNFFHPAVAAVKNVVAVGN